MPQATWRRPVARPASIPAPKDSINAMGMLQPAMEALAAAITVDENGRGTIPGDLDLVYDYSGGARPGWLLNGVPSYDDGVLSETFAKETLGFMKKNAASKVMCVSKTNGEQFAAYIEKVKSEGYTVLQRADWDGLTAYQCDKDDVSFYAYYADGTKEARIILEKSDTVSLEEFNYTAEPADGASNDVYLFGVMMDPDGIDFAYNGNTRLNCGQMLFMKLADNSLVIIDGGGVQQMSVSAAEEFLRRYTVLKIRYLSSIIRPTLSILLVNSSIFSILIFLSVIQLSKFFIISILFVVGNSSNLKVSLYCSNSSTNTTSAGKHPLSSNAHIFILHIR